MWGGEREFQCVEFERRLFSGVYECITYLYVKVSSTHMFLYVLFENKVCLIERGRYFRIFRLFFFCLLILLNSIYSVEYLRWLKYVMCLAFFGALRYGLFNLIDIFSYFVSCSVCNIDDIVRGVVWILYISKWIRIPAMIYWLHQKLPGQF